jgi:hypothetical protein
MHDGSALIKNFFEGLNWRRFAQTWQPSPHRLVEHDASVTFR